MDRKLLTKIITFSFILPVTAVSVPLLIIGILMWPIIIFEMSFSDIYKTVSNPGNWSIGELAPIAVPLGIWGLFTLWKLALHYMRKDCLPQNLILIYAGLLAGFISTIQLMINILSQPRGGNWIAYLLILALFSGLYFFFLLITSHKEIHPAAKV